MFFYLISTFFVLIFFIIYNNYQYWKRKGILYVKPVPFFGMMWDFLGKGKTYNECLHSIYHKYDTRYFGIYQYFQPVLFIKDIDLIKQVGIKDFDNFTDHKDFFSSGAIGEPVFEHNLFALKGQKWRDMRTLLSPVYTTSKMRLMAKLIIDCSQQFAKYFEDNSNADQTTVFQMKDIFERYANDVIATCAFGIECNSLKDKENEFYRNGAKVSDFTGGQAYKYIAFDAFGEIMRYFNLSMFDKETTNWFRNFVKSTTDYREKNNIYRPDIIHLLMEARKGKLKREINADVDNDAGFGSGSGAQTAEETTSLEENKNYLTDDEIAGQVILFFIAGLDTIATAMEFMAYELAVNEDVQRRLQDEIDDVMERFSGNLNYDIIVKMKYMEMVVNEVIRKWPPVFHLHRASNGNYTIPAKEPNEKDLVLKKGSIVWIPIYSIHRDPKYYPDPEKFDPERFNEENKKNINPLTYLSFGVGPRYCIGSRFGLLELKALFLNLLWKFDIVVTKETNVPVKIHNKKPLLGSADGIYLGFKLRNKN